MAEFFGSIILFILFCILFVVVLGVMLLAKLVGGYRNLWNLVRGKGFSANSRKSGYYGGDNSQQQTTVSEKQGDRPHSKGVFDDDEGTYVDFEEIKE